MEYSQHFLARPQLQTYLFQTLLFMVPVLVSYPAYKWVRAPLKYEQARQALWLLGVPQAKDLEGTMAGEYLLKHYIWPLVMACLTLVATYTMVHPYIIQGGLFAGLYEEVIKVFGADNSFPTAIAVGRLWFYAWFGGYIYSIHLIFRRFLAYDLTPSVYVFVSNRFLLAFTVGGLVIGSLGTLSTKAGVSFDVNMATLAVITFFIGFFPDQGLNWITATAKKALKQQGGISKEIPLSEIEGLSIWHQGRLNQEGIENVQNLATVDVPVLVISVPFTVGQIVDWIDQAILLVYVGQEQFEALEKVGLRCASDVLTAVGDATRLSQLAGATGLDKNGLRMLYLALQSAPNIKLVSRFRWQSSMDMTKVEEAKRLVQMQVQPVMMDQFFG